MAVLPMFPLGTVLMPGALLPLQVFEPRYQRLVHDVLAAHGELEFGQTLITQGHEVGGGDRRAEVGTRARMHDVRAVGEGRYRFVAVGLRRLRVVEWLDDDPYPRAVVEDWPDEGSGGDDLADRATAAAQRVREVLVLAGAPADAVAGLVPADDPVMASYQLAAIAPIGPADRHRLLAAAGAAERFDVLAEVLDDVEAVVRFRRGGS